MFGLDKLFKKDPLEKLRRDYAAKVSAATAAQRSGKMPLFASLTAEAEEIGKEMDRLEAEGSAAR